MIDPAKVALFIPANLRRFKLILFERIGRHIEANGGQVIRHDVERLAALPNDILPIVGCMPECTALIKEWRRTGRHSLHWDRGYARRIFATWLPRGENGGFYRWHLDAFQMQAIRDVPDDRWKALRTATNIWSKNGKHIVIAAPTQTYSRFHHLENWIETTLDALARVTQRSIVIRCKETKRPLQFDLEGAHALVTHGSIAAVEAVILGCPVFVDKSSAAALVGQTDLDQIEKPVYPDRQPWLNALAYSQFDEAELVDGTLWSLIS